MLTHPSLYLPGLYAGAVAHGVVRCMLAAAATGQAGGSRWVVGVGNKPSQNDNKL